MDALGSGQLLVAAIVTGALYALVALGLNLIYGTMRLLNVAHGELVMLGAYVGYWLFTLAGIGTVGAVFVAVALTTALGVAAYYGLFRRVLASSTLLARLEANSLLLFFGISVILQNLVSLAFTANPRGYQYLDTVIRIGEVGIVTNRLVALGIALVACVGVLLYFRLTTTGLAIKALIQSREAAAVVGINIDRVQLISFCLGFGAAGLAGALISMLVQTTPFMGFPFTIAAFVVIVLGGLGNLGGSLIGGMVLGFLETYGVALTSASYRSILIYGVFIAVLMWHPQGMFGTRRSRG